MTAVSVFIKQVCFRTSLFCLLASFSAVSACAAENAFPPELFPGLSGKSEAEIRLAGIAALNPGRIFDHDPLPAKPPVPEMRRTRVAELPRGGEYVRLYAPESEAVRACVGKRPLIVDCRYMATTPADLEKCLALGGELGASVGLSYRGEYPGASPAAAGAIVLSTPPARAFPIVVIVNRQTSGPIEAVLASLQAAGKISLVGGNTAGLSGVYKPEGGRWILTGEVLPDTGGSLVGVGAAPKFSVKTTPEDEFLVWQLVERGTPLSGVLRSDGAGSTSVGKAADAAKVAAHPEAVDVALQRATDILAALGVLGGEGK